MAPMRAGLQKVFPFSLEYVQPLMTALFNDGLTFNDWHFRKFRHSLSLDIWFQSSFNAIKRAACHNLLLCGACFTLSTTTQQLLWRRLTEMCLLISSADVRLCYKIFCHPSLEGHALKAQKQSLKIELLIKNSQTLTCSVFRLRLSFVSKAAFVFW